MRMFVRDLVLDARIGAFDHEKQAPQRIRLNVDFRVADPGLPAHDRLDEVVCYDRLIGAIRDIIAAGHIHLLETLAHRIADRCLADPRIRSITVRIEKLDIIADAASVGVEIERTAP
ncbi:MAG: dihydroneopterin aldolase [Azospirillaceae bacterium]|nr:dihydroneopterin aldolase [Azospirillaceae bacterium]